MSLTTEQKEISETKKPFKVFETKEQELKQRIENIYQNIGAVTLPKIFFEPEIVNQVGNKGLRVNKEEVFQSIQNTNGFEKVVSAYANGYVFDHKSEKEIKKELTYAIGEKQISKGEHFTNSGKFVFNFYHDLFEMGKKADNPVISKESFESFRAAFMAQGTTGINEMLQVESKRNGIPLLQGDQITEDKLSSAMLLTRDGMFDERSKKSQGNSSHFASDSAAIVLEKDGQKVVSEMTQKGVVVTPLSDWIEEKRKNGELQHWNAGSPFVKDQSMQVVKKYAEKAEEYVATQRGVDVKELRASLYGEPTNAQSELSANKTLEKAEPKQLEKAEPKQLEKEHSAFQRNTEKERGQVVESMAVAVLRAEGKEFNQETLKTVVEMQVAKGLDNDLTGMTFKDNSLSEKEVPMAKGAKELQQALQSLNNQSPEQPKPTAQNIF